MIPENTSRASAAPVSNGQPMTLLISYFDRFRHGLGAVVRHFAGADRMQQDRPSGPRDDLVDRQERLLVDGRSVDIGVQLDRIGAVAQDPFHFPDRRLRRVHRERRRIAGETLRVLDDELGELVIADAGPFRSMLGVPQAVDRGHCERQYLAVVGKRIDAEPHLEVPQRGNAADALAHVLLGGRRFEHAGEKAPREKMIEGVDVFHDVFSPMASSPAGRLEGGRPPSSRPLNGPRPEERALRARLEGQRSLRLRRGRGHDGPAAVAIAHATRRFRNVGQYGSSGRSGQICVAFS
jgi:hypothetical protein